MRLKADRLARRLGVIVFAACCSGVGAAQTPSLRTAIDALQAGRYEEAQEIASELASCPVDPIHRAWLIAADARAEMKQYSSAVRAYRLYLSGSVPEESRRYVLSRMQQCRAALASATVGARSPSARLTAQELAELGRVYGRFFTECSDNFVVKALNPLLAKLIAAEAQSCLRRIVRDILGDQEFPHVVEIHVWGSQREYLANARNAEDWSGGRFSIQSVNGLLTRRIDLTQCDSKGAFLTIMLDRILPHEMSHLVMQERFGDAPCPLFLNEGLAMVNESADHNERILRAGAVLADEADYSLESLLLHTPPDGGQAEAFYALSYSFTSYLYSRLSHQRFDLLLEHIKEGCTFADALQRTLHVVPRDDFLLELCLAWRKRAEEDAYFVRSLMQARNAAEGQ
ncbi:MAG: hypothetical protein GXY38_03575 [Planctomycetes bacterium]|jgi:hypothetical protein|nr:hypothetical protein [Planctomycetota bacterium]